MALVGLMVMSVMDVHISSHSPDGHKMEILWDVEYYQATEDQKTPLLNRPQKRPNRGVPVRRLDHVNVTSKRNK